MGFEPRTFSLGSLLGFTIWQVYQKPLNGARFGRGGCERISRRYRVFIDALLAGGGRCRMPWHPQSGEKSVSSSRSHRPSSRAKYRYAVSARAGDLEVFTMTANAPT